MSSENKIKPFLLFTRSSGGGGGGRKILQISVLLFTTHLDLWIISIADDAQIGAFQFFLNSSRYLPEVIISGCALVSQLDRYNTPYSIFNSRRSSVVDLSERDYRKKPPSLPLSLPFQARASACSPAATFPNDARCCRLFDRRQCRFIVLPPPPHPSVC